MDKPPLKKPTLPLKKTTKEDVVKFLTKTGFILEMEVAEILEKLGYKIQVNRYFHDYDEDKKREIDIIATKEIGGISVFLIIECKQSLIDDWIFICSDKRPSRYYNYVKHSPRVSDLEKIKAFDHLYLLDHSVPLAQNYIIRDKTKKKSTSAQVEICLEKLPKALISLADFENSDKARTIYLPIAVFSGQIFLAHYDGSLKINEFDLVQYSSEVASEKYTYHWRNLFPMGMGDEEKSIPNSPIAETSLHLGYRYLIDFVTKEGLVRLVSIIEAGIKKIDLEKWSLPAQIEEK